MTTKKQKAANRRNAKKSTGPKSEAGKKKSRMNALLHGVYGTIPSTGFEDREVFNKYMRAVAMEYNPSSDIEWYDCKQLAILMVRRERLMNYERLQLEDSQATEISKLLYDQTNEKFNPTDATDEQKAIGVDLAPMLSLDQVERIAKLDALLNAQIDKLRKAMDKRREDKELIIEAESDQDPDS